MLFYVLLSSTSTRAVVSAHLAVRALGGWLICLLAYNRVMPISLKLICLKNFPSKLRVTPFALLVTLLLGQSKVSSEISVVRWKTELIATRLSTLKSIPESSCLIILLLATESRVDYIAHLAIYLN